MKLAVFGLLALISHGADAKFYESVTVSEVTSIYDADTFRGNIAGYPDIIGKHVSIRVKGIDAPEIRGKCAAEIKAARIAKQFTVDHLRSGSKIELKNTERGKYFRILADVFIDGRELSKLLIESGNAREYHGGTRGSWCDK
jgi:endonuclease YncB( thermonuclease family)